MIRAGISGNEWWPVLEIEEGNGYDAVYEFTQEEIGRYKAALTEWQAVQEMLHAKVDAKMAP
jgi:hypothetical protein